MKWRALTTPQQIEEIIQLSKTKPVFIFKHSTTCGISHSVLNKVEPFTDELAEKFELFYLDLLSYRAISNQVAATFGVIHQSPQAILIKDGQAVKHASHYAINPADFITVA